MPTLLQINATLNSGSTGKIAEQIAMTATKHGWNCFLAHGGRYLGKSQFNAIQVSSKMDNYTHAFKGEYLGLHGLGSTVSTKRFVEKLKVLKPDIIHLHNIHGYYLNYKVLFEYLARAKTPVVWTLHDCWSFTGHCTHFDKIGCEMWKHECGHCPQLMTQYKSRLIDRSKKNFLLKKELYGQLSNLTIVPVSNWLESLVKQSILKQFTIRVIHNGVDVSVFRPVENCIRKKYGIPDDKLLILGVGSSGTIKGKQEFIKLSTIKDYQILLVGLTDNIIKELPESIIKIKTTESQSELAEYYSAADLLLNASYSDTFPTINLEALACGTPVVTYRAGGSPEAIDEETGIVVEKGDFDGLVTAINEVRIKTKSAYSKACRNRAVTHFNKCERFEEYIHLYEEISSDYC